MQTGVAWMDTRWYEKQFLVYSWGRDVGIWDIEDGEMALVKFQYRKARLKIDEARLSDRRRYTSSSV